MASLQQIGNLVCKSCTAASAPTPTIPFTPQPVQTVRNRRFRRSCSSTSGRLYSNPSTSTSSSSRSSSNSRTSTSSARVATFTRPNGAFRAERRPSSRTERLVVASVSQNGAADGGIGAPGSGRSSVVNVETLESTELGVAVGHERGELVLGEETGADDFSGRSGTPSFSTSEEKVTLLDPFGSLPATIRGERQRKRPLFLYISGMDCTGQGILSQLSFLDNAGYDIRCLYIPSTDRSTWQQLEDMVLPLMMHEVEGEGGKSRHLTILGESFGGGLAMRLAKAAPSLVSRLVLINPATNFPKNNLIGSLAAQTGLLAFFPEPLYEVAQDILLPLIVKRNRVSAVGNFLSPLDLVSADCAAWRLSMLNDESGLEDFAQISTPTLLIASGKDRVLDSMKESARLHRILPDSRRAVLPESGHTPLHEDAINIVDIMLSNGFTHPTQSNALPFSATGGALPKKKESVPDENLDELGAILRPWRDLTSPLVSGTENLSFLSYEPRRPVLFVGNHTMFGIYDSPMLVYELYLRGFRCRGLAHPGHWATGVGSVFERYGNVKATMTAAYNLLKEGEHVLLFPGGAREVCKRKGEKYKLLWKETTDFVRMAARHNAIIVPFGALGGDDAYDILYDSDDLRASAIWPLVERIYSSVGLDTVNTYPVTALPGTKIPSPYAFPGSIERIYFHFAEPVDTKQYASSIKDRGQMQSLYEMVKTRVEDSIELLKDVRENDPEKELPRRMLAKFSRLLPEFIPRFWDRPEMPR